MRSWNANARARTLACLCLVVTLVGAGCGGGSYHSDAAEVTRADVVANYAELMFRNYSAIEVQATALQGAIDAFLAAPGEATFADAKQAWLDARPTYQQSEMGRFYDGPIDDPVDGPEGQINAWPLDEQYVDYVVGAPDAGIINDPVGFPVISKDILADANEQGGETNIATGWHAIEFLLWGQDLSPDGPGARPFTDYVADGSGTAAHQDRRAQYLGEIAALLVDDIRSLVAEWAPERSDNFRAAFVSADPDESLGRILTGMGTLSGGELAGERMSVAFETRDSEDEHSCFSDNTHIDHEHDQIGIQNAYFGRFDDLDGAGIDDLVRALDPSLDTMMQEELAASLAAIQSIPRPFDQAILGADSTPGRQAVAAAIDALFDQTDTIALIADTLGITVGTTP